MAVASTLREKLQVLESGRGTPSGEIILAGRTGISPVMANGRLLAGTGEGVFQGFASLINQPPAAPTWLGGAEATVQGDPADDFSKEPLPNGGRINLGAFGGTAEAELSPPPEPVAGPGPATAPPAPDPAADAGTRALPPAKAASAASPARDGAGCSVVNPVDAAPSGQSGHAVRLSPLAIAVCLTLRARARGCRGR